MLMRGLRDGPNKTKFQEFLPGTAFYQDIRDTAHILSINDSMIQFMVQTKNVYSSRDDKDGSRGQTIKDTVDVLFAVTSPDSTNPQSIVSKFDSLKTKKVKSKLFFNIVSDTLYWYKNLNKFIPAITMDDVIAGDDMDYVHVYFNAIKLDIKGTDPFCYLSFTYDETLTGDGYFLFGKDTYNFNKSLGLAEGTYTITMKESKTGIPIESKRGKNKIYLKYVN